MKLTVTKDFDYRHPSGMAVTALKADPEPITTKREIAEYAVKMGYGFDPEAKPKATGGAVKPANYAIGKGDGLETFTPADGGKIVATK